MSQWARLRLREGKLPVVALVVAVQTGVAQQEAADLRWCHVGFLHGFHCVDLKSPVIILIVFVA